MYLGLTVVGAIVGAWIVRAWRKRGKRMGHP